ncbi:MAG: nucleotide exchange factor GrpE [Methanosarcinaceae archaeon]|nr:nucleotide exchange factor GrpE [Methanosarcinaceae archaeon]MDD4498512.1 nucleotide exchange factor GrpE [Methanosarcinaceae archaeon]
MENSEKNKDEASCKAESGQGPETSELRTEEVCREENEKLKEKLIRLAADFDNYKKRSIRQMEDSHKFVLEGILVELLEVSDNFERALKSAKKSGDMDSVINGIEQLSRQFNSILEKHGLEKIECGEASEFDPHLHEAVQYVETRELPDHTVFEVYKPGYILNSKVIRPAMVAVARNESAGSENAEKNDTEE